MRYVTVARPMIVCLCLVLLAGCVLGLDSRLTNQGGGNLVTAAGKAAGGNLTSLTPDEIQVASDFAIDQYGLPISALTDSEAAAVAQFLDDNQLHKIEDVQALQQNPENVVISADVRVAVESFLRGLGTDVSLGGPVGSQGMNP